MCCMGNGYIYIPWKDEWRDGGNDCSLAALQALQALQDSLKAVPSVYCQCSHCIVTGQDQSASKRNSAEWSQALGGEEMGKEQSLGSSCLALPCC